MKNRILTAFIFCLIILIGIKIYSVLHSGIDANSLQKIDGVSIWRTKDEKGKWHIITEYCRFDDQAVGNTKILHCRCF